MLKHWRTLSSNLVYDAGIFQIRKDHNITTDKEKDYYFHVISSKDWVQIIPIMRLADQKDKIILVKQFRHGTKDFFLEIPGGICNEGEEFKDAAKRELLEETGFRAKSIEHLADFYPNPSIQDNKSHVYVAYVDPKQKVQSLDPAEDIEVIIKNLEEVLDNPLKLGLSNAIILTGLLLYDKKYKKPN